MVTVADGVTVLDEVGEDDDEGDELVEPEPYDVPPEDPEPPAPHPYKNARTRTATKTETNKVFLMATPPFLIYTSDAIHFQKDSRMPDHLFGIIPTLARDKGIPHFAREL